MTPALPFDASEATRHLIAADPVLGELIARVGPCALVPGNHSSPFHALVRSIIYQQLHGKAAATIHGRLIAIFGNEKSLTPARLLATPETQLRAAGLSAGKLAALRDLAAKTIDGTVPNLAAARKLSDAQLIERLTAVRGIGDWTVHMLLVFYLGRPDVLPTGDFAIRKAFRLLYGKRREPSPETITRHARSWQPYRSVASWYLWRSLDSPIPTAT
jgi:3-methyladenine DNA glycosylase/8-oxoguanine DNA glycosylase